MNKLPGVTYVEWILRWRPHVLRIAFAILWIAATAVPAAAEATIDFNAALKERVIGDPTAPITMIEYASLTCPHCASFHNDTYKAFKERYIDTGKVKLIYRDFPLDGVALRAAMMARCTIDQRYFGLVGVLYKNQHKWTRASDPLAELANIGRLAGISDAIFDACMASEELLDGVLRIRQQGTADGVRSTPTFIIDGTVYPGSRSIDEFAQIIDVLLKND
jgi:protein-disulfide isomerase